jgi:hypothetical protein
MRSRPEPVDAAAVLLDRYPATWALCGGWGVDAWLGSESRPHVDVDIAMLDEDQPAIRAFFGDGWVLAGHDPFDDDSETQWDGHRLVLPAHIHARGHEQNLDIQLELVEDREWVFRASPRLTMPMAQAVRESPWRVPTLAPEAILFYKSAADRRAHDEADFEALVPLLSGEARGWLAEALETTEPVHDWLARLRA